jgi:hypothetical protein
MLAVVGELLDESISDGAAAALALNICCNAGKISKSRSPIDEAGQLRSFGNLVEAIQVIANVTTHVFSSMASSFCLGGIEHFPQLGALDPVDGITHRVFRSWKAPSGDLGFNPFGGVWSKLNLHGNVSLALALP